MFSFNLTCFSFLDLVFLISFSFFSFLFILVYFFFFHALFFSSDFTALLLSHILIGGINIVFSNSFWIIYWGAIIG